MTRLEEVMKELAELTASPYIEGPANEITGELSFLTAETHNKHVAELEGELRGLETK